jgi:hypothetical protein
VAENKAKYTVSDYQRAEKARTIQRRIGRPSTKRYIELANKNRIKNCNVTGQDIRNAEHIFGPEKGSLQGKTVRKASDQVISGNLVPIPATILSHYRRVVLCVDVMKVNKMPFLVTISRAIKFGTVAWLKNAKAATILENIKIVRNTYVKRGFLLEIVEADGQFEPIQGELAALGITLNKCSREEHVPVAERRIRTLKERCRCIFNTLPFKKLPGMLIVQMVSTCNFWLNIFPPKDGVSRAINPRELITGTTIDFNKHIRAEFGEYVQVHEEHDNTMKTRTTGAIATKPTGNAQGGHWFYSLTTGRMLDRRQWTPLPMPADVIERIHVLAKASQIGMNFTNMRNEIYDDSGDNDSEYDSDEDSDYGSDDESSEGDDDDYDDFIEGVDIDNPQDPPDPPTANVDETQQNQTDNDDVDDDDDDDDGGDDIAEDDDGAETIHENENENNDVDSDDDTEFIPESENDSNDTGDEPTDGGDEEPPIISAKVRKLADYNGVIPPIMQSRTRQQAQETGESLVTGTNSEDCDITGESLVTGTNSEDCDIKIQRKLKNDTKKQRKHEKELEAKLLKRAIQENKKKISNKLKKEKRRIKLKTKKEEADPLLPQVETIYENGEGPEDPEDETDLTEFGDLRDQLQASQKPGVIFPHDNDTCSSKVLTPELEAIALTQYTLKRGLKEFGVSGIEALGKEVGQLHTRKVAKPVDSRTLTRAEKQAALRYLMFLTKKRCGRIKARGCADGRKQRASTKKEDASAPTVAIESVMLSATIDATEERDVATVDIPGAFMQADIDELVHVKFEGEIAEMLVKMDPKLYRKYVKDENGKTVLYVELLKALYGTMRAALLFWKLLSRKLIEWGFTINPYD